MNNQCWNIQYVYEHFVIHGPFQWYVLYLHP